MLPADSAELAAELIAGNDRALARAITLVENDDPAGWEILKAVYPRTGSARTIGVTGPPGVGKSTLIGAMVGHLRARDQSVAVLSIDPSSPFSHGALLGDRIRLAEHFLDSGVFIRSMANRGALGGLSEATLQAALLMDAAGHENVFVETVGVGQAEIDVIDHADTVVLALMPGSGDSVQALKAGVMEIPDVIAVNKADHPMTDTLVREIKGVLALGGPVDGWSTRLVCTQAVDDVGVDELIAAVDAHGEHLRQHGGLAERRRRNLRSEVMELATAALRRELEAEVSADSEAQALIDEVVERRLDPASAARELLRRRKGD